MGEKFKAFSLGIFIIAGIAITSWLILFLKPSVGDGEVLLKVRFSNIDKVEKGTRVTFAGKPVGQVHAIKEIPNPRKGPSDEFGNLYVYELTLKVDSAVRVFSYDEIIFATSGLLGEKSIAIIPKAAPPGAPPPQNVSDDVLFARSTDKLEETLNQIGQVADKFGDTMDGINAFISDNTGDFNLALKSVSGGADALTLFVNDVKEQQVLNRLGESFDHINRMTAKIERGEGTLGRLISSDSFYLQASGLVCKLDTLLNDINNYGLLFQYDKSWQRSRTAKANRMKCLRTPCEFYNHFDREVDEISVSLGRVGQLLQTMECQEIPVNSDCFAQSFMELMSRVECLHDSLKLYTEMLLGEYCQKCSCQ